jgi:hypothetical protein
MFIEVRRRQMNSSVNQSAIFPWPKGPRQGWLPEDIDIERLRHRLGANEIAAIRERITAIREAGTPLFEVTLEQFRHPLLDKFVWPLVHELREGAGVLLLAGFDQLGDDIDDWRLAYWGIGSYFGEPVSQSVRGDLMGDVKVRLSNTTSRVYTSPAPVRLHSDRIDMLSLLCVQKAKAGGTNGFASSLAIRDIIARERPDVLKILERGFRQSRGNEQQPDQDPITPYRVPVFAEKDGLVSCLLSGNCSRYAQEHMVKDPLNAEELEALDFLMAVLERPEIRITVGLERGEAVFLNNYEVVHARDTFEDGDEPTQKRHLLRLWLAGRPHRPRVAEQSVIVNPSGKLGIDPQPAKLDAEGNIVSVQQ